MYRIWLTKDQKSELNLLCSEIIFFFFKLSISFCSWSCWFTKLKFHSLQALLATASKQVELAESLEGLKETTLTVRSYYPLTQKYHFKQHICSEAPKIFCPYEIKLVNWSLTEPFTGVFWFSMNLDVFVLLFTCWDLCIFDFTNAFNWSVWIYSRGQILVGREIAGLMTQEDEQNFPFLKNT